LLKEITSERIIDVFGCVRKIHQQGPYMMHTLVWIYLLKECICTIVIIVISSIFILTPIIITNLLLGLIKIRTRCLCTRAVYVTVFFIFQQNQHTFLYEALLDKICTKDYIYRPHPRVIDQPYKGEFMV